MPNATRNAFMDTLGKSNLLMQEHRPTVKTQPTNHAATAENRWNYLFTVAIKFVYQTIENVHSNPACGLRIFLFHEVMKFCFRIEKKN